MMRTRFEQQLLQLNSLLIEMGGYVEQTIAMSTKALTEQNIALARKAIAFDNEIDGKEKEIESLCLKLLLQQQPVARDLRLISSALKMITDMERIGDQSADIAEITIYLADRPHVLRLEHIPQMAESTIRMVTDSIDAFVKKDLALANSVVLYDDIVDGLFDTVKSDLIALIRQDPASGDQALDLLMIAKYFERIGDHAVNIAEWVIFSLTGTHKDSRIL